MAVRAYKSATFQQAPTLSDFYRVVQRAPSPHLILDVVGEAIELVEPAGCCFNFSSSPSPLERAVSRRAWEAFERAIGQESDPAIRDARLERIERRYHLNFNQLKEDGLPLLVDHIEKFAIASAKLFHQDISALAGGRNNLSRSEVAHFITAIQNVEFVGRAPPAHELRGGPDSFADYFWHDAFKLDRKRVHLSWPEDVERLTLPDHLHNRYPHLPKDLPWINRLAMVFTSLEMEVGELIPAPSNGGIDYYRVYEKIGTGDGLVAYALKPLAHDSELAPMLVFRPSQMSLVAEDALETLFNDMEANIGETGYNAAHPLFTRLMQDPHFHDNRKILLVGYSLGSSQAQRFLKDFWRLVYRAVLINGPSIDRATAQQFAAEMNHPDLVIEGDPLKIEVCRNREDIADKAGETHLGWGVRLGAPVEISLVEFQNAPIMSRLLGSHSYRPLEPAHLDALQSEEEIGVPHLYPRHELDVQLDNFQRGPEIEWYERTRQFWGTQVLYNIIYGLYVFVKTLLACFGIQLFRSSRRIS